VRQRADEISEEERSHQAARPAAAPTYGSALQLGQQAGNRAVAGLLQQWDSHRSDDAGLAECYVALPPEVDQGPLEPVVDEDAAHASVSAPAPTASGIGGAAPVSWAALNALDDDGCAHAIPGPSTATLAAIQAAAGGGTGVVGWTSFPLATAKAPQFDLGAVSSAPGGMGPPSWSCTPKWVQHYYEGDSVCMYLAAGRHPTALTEAGKPVFFQVTAAISARDGQAEAEHSNDIKQARDISIKEAETLLTDHIIGQTFPATGTQAEAEQKVLDRITAKLTHAGLGNDQTKWAGIYETLYRKTLGRDNKGWHTFALGARTTNPAGEVTYELTNGTTSINTTTSAALIVY
jgi:hypothetical protein